jgi:hypothetical protein
MIASEVLRVGDARGPNGVIQRSKEQFDDRGIHTFERRLRDRSPPAQDSSAIPLSASCRPMQRNKVRNRVAALYVASAPYTSRSPARDHSSCRRTSGTRCTKESQRGRLGQ